jgi:hypothetical protein
MRKFIDDDKGYLGWVASSTNGFVVNIMRSLNPSTAILHRADCWTINGEPARGKAWTDEYIKICSASMEELESWMKDKAGGHARKCKICKP